jgi:2-C-methyl-D-erythritol 2,4-cyclodiphosphate synthase
MTDQWRVGQGWDIHRLAEGCRLVLGGVEIPFDRGLAGHSDADVLLHAVIDAVLGAMGDADIGTHFPDNDPAWRDAPSRDMLATIGERAREAGWQVVNVDTTLVAEAPKIGPYREGMREVIAWALGVEPSTVSIKAKTAEGLGPEGTGKAISAQAVVLLRRAAD